MRGFEEGVSRSRIFTEDFAFFFDCFDDSGGEGSRFFGIVLVLMAAFFASISVVENLNGLGGSRRGVANV
jgi:hypothetical protein